MGSLLLTTCFCSSVNVNRLLALVFACLPMISAYPPQSLLTKPKAKHVAVPQRSLVAKWPVAGLPTRFVDIVCRPLCIFVH